MNLLQASGCAAAMTVVIVLIRALFLHKLAKRVFVVLWCLVLLRLLLPVSIPSPTSVFTLWNHLFQAPAATSVSKGAITLASLAGTAQGGKAGTGMDLQVFLTAVWLFCAGVCGVFLLFFYGKNHRTFSRSLPLEYGPAHIWLINHPLVRQVKLRVCDEICSPLTYGLFRPVILLPKNHHGWDEAQLHAVLSHEMAHIRHWDALKKGALFFALCLHWFNPFVWLMVFLFNRDIELACDESALKQADAGAKSKYTLFLLRLEKEKSEPLPFGNYFSKYALEERILALMKQRKPTSRARFASVLLVVGLAACFGTTGCATGGAASAAPLKTTALGTQNGNVTDLLNLALSNMLDWDLTNVRAEWEKYGVSYNALEDRVYYKGELVRFFMDNRSPSPDSFSGSVYDCGDGSYYLVTQRDANGKLVGILEVTPEEADKLASWR